MTTETFGTTDNGVPAEGSPEAAAAAAAAVAAAAVQPAATPAFELKVGDRTFNSQASAVDHINHTQAHITKIEAENASLRESKVSLEQKASEVDEIKAQVQTLLAEVQKNQHSESPATTSPTDVATLVSAVKESISADSAATTESDNWKDSSAAAKALWGDDYLGKIQSKADELGMSIIAIDRMAKESPKAFKQVVLGVAPQSRSNTALTESSVNASSLHQENNNQSGERFKFTKANSKDRANNVAERIAAKESQQ